MPLEIFNVEQGTDAWKECRRGVITASCFKDVLAGGQGITRKKYLLKLAGERITGEIEDCYTNANMERGKLLEDQARQLYCERTGFEVQKVGFIRNGYLGYSPDSLVAKDRIVEIKVAIASVQAERLLADKMPPEHKAQCQGGLEVSERQISDFVSYCPGMPLFIKTTEREEIYIATLRKEVEVFERELQETVTRLTELF